MGLWRGLGGAWKAGMLLLTKDLILFNPYLMFSNCISRLFASQLEVLLIWWGLGSIKSTTLCTTSLGNYLAISRTSGPRALIQGHNCIRICTKVLPSQRDQGGRWRGIGDVPWGILEGDKLEDIQVGAQELPSIKEMHKWNPSPIALCHDPTGGMIAFKAE